MEAIMASFAMVLAALPWVFVGYVLCNLENVVRDLQDSMDNLSVSVERLADKNTK